MALYDFYCEQHHLTDQVRASMEEGPMAPLCPIDDAPMQRVYGSQDKAISVLDSTGYIERAYRGEINCGHMTTEQVRAIVDSRPRGQHSNARQYKTAR